MNYCQAIKRNYRCFLISWLPIQAHIGLAGIFDSCFRSIVKSFCPRRQIAVQQKMPFCHNCRSHSLYHRSSKGDCNKAERTPPKFLSSGSGMQAYNPNCAYMFLRCCSCCYLRKPGLMGEILKMFLQAQGRNADFGKCPFLLWPPHYAASSHCSRGFPDPYELFSGSCNRKVVMARVICLIYYFLNEKYL